MTDRNNISNLLGKTIAGIRMSASGHSHEFLDAEGNVFLQTYITATFDGDGNYMNDDSPVALPTAIAPSVEKTKELLADGAKRRSKNATDIVEDSSAAAKWAFPDDIASKGDQN